MSATFGQATRLLDQHNQSHVLRHYDDLDDEQRAALLAQINELEFDDIEVMQHALAKGTEAAAVVTDPVPAEVVSLEGAELAQARSAGEAALRAGEVGVILVAGGQGSRLGFDGPKGSFPIGPISDAPLFAIHAHKIAALEKKYGAEVPFYVMTSETNNAATCAFFEEHGHFGLNPERVHFFKQGMWPALWGDGRLVMDRPDHLFVAPDGHGGTLSALRANGMLDDMKSRGVETLFYFQVDNPLVEISDPVFIGLHRLRDSQISVKVCEKRDAQEGLGVVVQRGDRNAVVEYTELTEDQKNETLPDGKLRLRFGSVAIHVFSYEFLSREAAARLPLHLAHKKVPYCDDDGNTVTPKDPNAYKFEKFIFDTIPDAERTVNLAFDRRDEFSPVKNPVGDDSPDTARRDMVLKWARWLDACGVAVPRGDDGVPTVKIEIDPCYALGPDDLKQKLPADFSIDGDLLLA